MYIFTCLFLLLLILYYLESILRVSLFLVAFSNTKSYIAVKEDVFILFGISYSEAQMAQFRQSQYEDTFYSNTIMAGYSLNWGKVSEFKVRVAFWDEPILCFQEDLVASVADWPKYFATIMLT